MQISLMTIVVGKTYSSRKVYFVHLFKPRKQPGSIVPPTLQRVTNYNLYHAIAAVKKHLLKAGDHGGHFGDFSQGQAPL